jgi:hypothetical protein
MDVQRCQLLCFELFLEQAEQVRTSTAALDICDDDGNHHQA